MCVERVFLKRSKIKAYNGQIFLQNSDFNNILFIWNEIFKQKGTVLASLLTSVHKKWTTKRGWPNIRVVISMEQHSRESQRCDDGQRTWGDGFKEYDLCSPPRLIKDSLDHSRLLENVKILGVRRTGLEGFRRYLCGRKQYVSIGAETSSLGAFSHGVHPRSAPHFLFTMHVVWSSRLTLMMIYRRSRLRAIGIVSWST